MFWTLFLAHITADYPLQTDRMVQNKHTLQGLLLHVGIHFAVMLVLVSPAWETLWMYLLAVAGIHFSIDALKNLVAARKPKWVVGPYLIDQSLHILSLWGIVIWITTNVPAVQMEDTWLPLNGSWQIYASGYLVATYVWFISERIFARQNEIYLKEIQTHAWIRMGIRALLLSLFLLLGGILNGTAIAFIFTPYLIGKYHRKALLADIAIPLIIAILLKSII